MISDVLSFIKMLCMYTKCVLKSKYKWLLIVILVWTFRIVAMPAGAGGLEKGLQVLCIAGIFYFANKYKSGAMTYGYKNGDASIKWMLAFLTLGLISAAWSYAPQYSLFLSIEKIVMIGILLSISFMCKDIKTLEEVMLISLTGLLIFEAFVFRLKYPSLFVHTLTNGSCAAILFTYCVGELIAKRVKDEARYKLLKSVAALSLLFLVVSTSSGANVSAAFGVAVALFVSGKVIWALLLIAVGGILLLNQDLIDNLIMFLMPGKTKSMIQSSTGRTEIWALIKVYAPQKMWLGWGYAAIERLISDRDFPLTDAHNNYYGAWGSNGIIGLALLVMHHVASIMKGFTHRMRVGTSGCLCALCCAALNGYSFGFLSGKGCTITVFYFFIMVALFRYNQMRIYDASKFK